MHALPILLVLHLTASVTSLTLILAHTLPVFPGGSWLPESWERSELAGIDVQCD